MQISAINAVSLSAAASAPAPQASSTVAGATAAAVSASTSSNAAVDLLERIYTTRVAGKDYSGDVAYASGVYSISVASLPGAYGAGSSLTAAEDALNTRIDILA